MKIKGAIACGHPKTAEAAAYMLDAGGNAFDAVLAAHLAACICEPILCSLGGGGFLTAQPAGGKTIVYDFFTQTPKRKKPQDEVDFYPITADFGETTQEFHIGMGSIAAPGSVRGIFRIHRDLGTLPISIIAEPAIQYAKSGVELNSFQAYILDIIKPIYQHDKTCFETFKSLLPNAEKNLLRAGEVLKMPDLADALDLLVNEGDRFFYEGEIAKSIVKACEQSGGLLAHDDLKDYQVILREPLLTKYRDFRIYTNPPPSSGGILIAFALSLLQSVELGQIDNRSASYYGLLSTIMKLTNQARLEIESGNPKQIGQHLFAPALLDSYKKEVLRHYSFIRGTTQFSVVDGLGNIASLTTSNGEGSSFIAPHSGIILNNMLGEEDLHTKGFHQWQVDQRISSMMAPTIFFNDKQQSACALGSGGSNRIRSAILQVLVQLIDYGADLGEAIECPRVHFENELLSIENDNYDEHFLSMLTNNENIKLWNDKNLFFGGVHAVESRKNRILGKGDPRRGGVTVIR